MTNKETIKEAIEILKKNRPSWGTRECDKELCVAVDTAIEALNAFENIGAFVTKFADSYDYALVAKDVWRDAKKALEEQGARTPCDLCRYNPPSSCDGKPCSYCTAEGK